MTAFGMLLSAFVIHSGTYVPSHGNNNSICPQEVKTYLKQGVLTGLRVFYVGDCFREGPYFYSCDGDTCLNGSISIQLQGSDRYLWTNVAAGVWAKFSLTRSEPVLR